MNRFNAPHKAVGMTESPRRELLAKLIRKLSKQKGFPSVCGIYL